MTADPGSRNRARGWRSALHRCIEERRRIAFTPGTQDCGLFAADCVRAITGVDHAAAYRGAYSTIEEGLGLLSADGFADHVAFAESCLTEIPLSEMQSGDLAVVENPGADPSIGVISGAVIQVVTDSGIGTVSIERASRVFKVG